MPRAAKTHLQTVREKHPPAPRTSAHKRGYGARWRRARAYFLRHNPLCAECERQGRPKPATIVDHIKPHRGDADLFWDVDNWQALCATCHSVKTKRGE